MVIMIQPSVGLDLSGVVIGGTLAVAAVTFYVMRHEIAASLREVVQDLPPTRLRIAVATFMALIGAVVLGSPLCANPVYNPCNWEYLLEKCSGYEACAWAAWISAGCMFLPG